METLELGRVQLRPLVLDDAVERLGARFEGTLRALTDAAFDRMSTDHGHAVVFGEDENTAFHAAHEHLGFTELGTFTWQERPFTVLVRPLG